MDQFRMPWGKFRGRRLADIESGYLCWCLDHADSLQPDLEFAIRAELRSRFGAPASSSPPPVARRSPCPDPALAADLLSAGLRVLAKRHHPDVGGDTAVMQKINAVAEWLKRTVPQ